MTARPAYSITCALLATLLAGVAAPAAQAADKGGNTIKKCQDAAGRWHYGDEAEACEQSKVVEMNSRGITVKEIAAPPTQAELRAREANKAELERQKKIKEDTERRDRQLLATYGHEDDIALTRDRKLSELDSQVRASEHTLKSLRSSLKRTEAVATEESKGGGAPSAQTAKQLEGLNAQIARHQDFVEQKKKEKDVIRAQADSDLKRYQELKQGGVRPGPTR